MADNKQSREVDLTKIQGMGNGNTTKDNGKKIVSCRKDGYPCCFEECELDGEKPSKQSDITVTVSADVGEAITGFKALQRELRETTKAAREMEASYDALNERIAERTMYIGSGYLSEVSTKELSEELAKREGVTCHYVAPHGAYAKLTLDNVESGGTSFIEGPATILVNID